ncbi:MAG: site-specific integrase [Cytophagaceae bacterium]|nr:site-specific integrase [Cytophagaceae bacterium]
MKKPKGTILAEKLAPKAPPKLRKNTPLAPPTLNLFIRGDRGTLNAQITYNGSKLPFFSSGIRCSPEDFDREKNVIRGDRTATLRIQTLVNRFNLILAHYEITSKPYNLEAIRDELLNIETKPILTLLEAARQFYASKYEAMSHEFTEGTLKAVRTKMTGVPDFVREYLGRDDMPLQEFTPGIAHDLKAYFMGKEHRGLRPSTANRHIKTFKGIFDFAVANGWLVTNPLTGYRHRNDYRPKPHLTAEQLEAMRGLVLASPSLQLERDLFLAQFGSGAADVDFRNLRPEDIKRHTDGTPYLVYTRQKTNLRAVVPLEEEFMTLVAKYATHPRSRGRLFPVGTNQHRNRELKTLGELARLPFQLTTHIARTTAASRLLNDLRLPPGVVAAILGHSNSIVTEKTYAHHEDETLVERVNQARKGSEATLRPTS